MEKRAILAFALSAALLLVYQLFFSPSPPPPPPPKAVEEKTTPPPAPPPPLPPPVKGFAEQVLPGREVAITSPYVLAKLSSVGGRITQWDLLKYQHRDERGVLLPRTLAVEGQLGPVGLLINRAEEGPREVSFTVKESALELNDSRPEGEVRLERTDRFGLEIVETFKFRSEGYLVEVSVQLTNRHTAPQPAEIDLRWMTNWPENKETEDWGQPIGIVELSDGQVRRTERKAAAESVKEGQWIAFESKWYLTALIPRSSGIKLVQGKSKNGATEVGLRFAPPPLAPGQRWEGRALLYIGPKEYDRLKAVQVGLEQTIHYGNFLLPFVPMEWFSVPLLWLLNWFFRFSGNYGIAIILLTVVIKIVFYPFTHISMKSMKAMQSLQPQINALKAKHKNDRQRIQQETMELYRKHRINPMSGCLPMVIQIPIFYALYLTLDLSVELQGAGFLCFGRMWGRDLWICDLSKADPIYVLPILMGASWFIQQKMTPTVGDPMQAKMMLLMPIVFTFMFFSFPAGLVLYWFVNNVLSIAQQVYNDRRTPRKARAAA